MLVYFDGTELSQKALRKTEDIIDPQEDRIILLAVIPDVKIQGVAAHDEKVGAELSDKLRKQVDVLKLRGIESTALLEYGDIVDIIVNRAEEMKVDLVVIGHGEEEHMSPFTLGSISEQASKRIHRPILIIQ